MRNGVKSYYNKNKTISPILIILFVIFLGFLIWFILNSKKVDINLDITSYDNLKDLKISNEGIIKAELYEEIENLHKILILLFMEIVQMNLSKLTLW